MYLLLLDISLKIDQKMNINDKYFCPTDINMYSTVQYGEILMVLKDIKIIRIERERSI